MTMLKPGATVTVRNQGEYPRRGTVVRNPHPAAPGYLEYRWAYNGGLYLAPLDRVRLRRKP